MQRQRLLHISLSLAVNVLFSLTLLPLAIPPFKGYSPSDLLGVLLWQTIGMVGWPFALLGIVLSIPLGAKLASADSLFILMYPAILFLLIRAVVSRAQQRWEFILLHVLVFFSFIVVWYYVLNGYDFMPG
jgi:hypothetical protein